MGDTFVDFRDIKQRISIQSVLDRYAIRLRRSNQSSLRGTCPLPTHSSEKSKESFSVQTSKNIWACQSSSCAATRGGKKGGNIIDFVSIMERCSIRDAAIKLHDWFLLASSPVLSPATPSPATAQKGSCATTKLVSEKTNESDVDENKPLAFTLKDIDFTHPYLRQRGLRAETVQHFGVGYFPGKGSMVGRVVIPINNERGELIAYAGRAIDATEPKYKVPSGFKKSRALFNLDRVLARVKDAQLKNDLVIVVEGFFDCMKVFQAGFPCVVALMGSSMSDVQESFLRHFRRVILFLDGDDAGRAGAQSIAERLMHRVFVKVVDLRDGKQPDQLSSDELKRILGSS